MCDLDCGKLTETSHLAYSILLPQLIATLIHYLCTVALPGLADWSAFADHVKSRYSIPSIDSTDTRMHTRNTMDIN